MRIANILFIAVAMAFVVTSCDKDDNKDNTSKIAEFSITAPNSGSWTYFSFSKNDTVKISGKAEESTEWDLAFQQYYIKTNSGVSGKGIGGAFNSNLTGDAGFTSLIAVPDTANFLEDDSITLYLAGGSQAIMAINDVLRPWYNYNSTTHALTSKLFVYVVKTANGKYVKLIITGYLYDFSGKSFFDLKYFYQKDGSKKLE